MKHSIFLLKKKKHFEERVGFVGYGLGKCFMAFSHYSVLFLIVAAVAVAAAVSVVVVVVL